MKKWVFLFFLLILNSSENITSFPIHSSPELLEAMRLQVKQAELELLQ